MAEDEVVGFGFTEEVGMGVTPISNDLSLLKTSKLAPARKTTISINLALLENSFNFIFVLREEFNYFAKVKFFHNHFFWLFFQ